MESHIDSHTRSLFSYWRTRTFFSIFIGYIFYYFTRKSYTFAMPLLATELHFQKSDLGLLVTVFSITYGISKFVCGVLGDKSNPRYFMGAGLILTGIFNLAFGMSSSLWLFVIFWGLNGWFQGFGWPPCARLLSFWYSIKNRGTWWSMWATAHNIGGGLTPLLVTLSIEFGGWRAALFVPGLICIVFGLVLMERLRDTPESLGLPSAEEIDGLTPVSKEVKSQARPSAKVLLFDHVINNRYIWYLALGNLFIYVVRTGVNDWTMLFLSEHRGFSLIEAGGTIPWFELGGMVGMILAGFCSDKLLENGRGVVASCFMAILALPLIGFWLIDVNSYISCSALLFVVGLFLFGPQMLVGCAAVERTSKEAAGTASGFAGVFGYLGAAIAGYPFGVLIDAFGWNGFFVVLIIAALLGSLCFVPLIPRQKGVTIGLAKAN
jgi:OPA family sugar phosphate sensor protein UhpC-like MFS transporter